MARGGNVRIGIVADPEGVRKGVKQAERDLDGLGKRGSSHLKSIGAAAAVSGGAAGLGLLAVGLTASVKASMEAEKTQARLEAQLKASGISYKAHAKQIDEVIQKHSQLSGLDDEDLTDAFTNIVRVTGDVDKSLRLTGLAADFARAKHLDVAKAGEIVGKVAGGNTGILKRYGIEIEKGATASQGLAALQGKFAGQAAAYGKTTAGSIDRAKVASQNLAETVGGMLAPAVTKGAGVLATLAVGAQQKLPGALATARRAVNTVRDAITGFVAKNRDDINSFLQAARNVGTVVKTVFDGFVLPTIRRLLPAFRQMFGGAVQVIRGAVRVISGILTGDFGKAWDGVKDIVRGGLRYITGAIRGATAGIRQAASMIGSAIVGGIKSAFTGGVGLVSDIGNAIRGWLNRVTPFGDKVSLGPVHFRIPALARGGPITGGTPGHDSVPALLMPGEHVWTSREVAAAGGHRAMYAMRRMFGGGSQATGLGMAAGGGVYNYAQLEGLWRRAGGPAGAQAVAAAVALAESGGNPGASNRNTNGTIDRGLWQINSIHGALSTFDVMSNARAAVRISSGGRNWQPWVTFWNGAYRRFLQSGVSADTGGPVSGITGAAKRMRRGARGFTQTGSKVYGIQKGRDAFTYPLEPGSGHAGFLKIPEATADSPVPLAGGVTAAGVWGDQYNPPASGGQQTLADAILQLAAEQKLNREAAQRIAATTGGAAIFGLLAQMASTGIGTSFNLANQSAGRGAGVHATY